MAFKRKGRVAAMAREAAKRLIRKSMAAPAFDLPKADESSKLPDAGKSTLPLELSIETDVKQEPNSIKNEDPFLQQDEVEVKEELLDPEDGSSPMDSVQDPIGHDGCRPLLQQQSNEDDEPDDRCQFCMKQFQECGGRGAITKTKIGFVLGLTQWGQPRKPPDCCEECRKMFNMFYEFKQACLAALQRQAELLLRTGRKKRSYRKRKRKVMEDIPESKVIHKQESHESVVINAEALPVELLQDVKQAECETLGEQVVDGMALDQPYVEQYSADTNETKTKKKKVYKPRLHKLNSAKTNKAPTSEIACTLCSRKFTYERALSYHMDKHNGVRTIPCRRDGCTKMFYHPTIRHTHEKYCGQDTQAICNVCGKVFRSEGSLRVHSSVHEDPQFRCEICNRSFHAKRRLQKHLSVHSDERRFQCQVCGKSFKSHEANRVHQRIHTDETPYVCHICGQRFRYNCVLKTHLEKGHESVPG